MVPVGLSESYEDGRRAAAPQDVKMHTRASTRAGSTVETSSSLWPNECALLLVGECFLCASKSATLTGDYKLGQLGWAWPQRS